MAGKCTRHLFRNDQNGKRNYPTTSANSVSFS